VGFHRTPKYIPNLLERNYSEVLSSFSNYNLLELRKITYPFILQKLLFLYYRMKIVRFFDTKPTSLFTLFVSLKEFRRTMEKRLSSHAHLLLYRFCSKQWMNCLIVKLVALCEYITSPVTYVLMSFLQMNTSRERLVITCWRISCCCKLSYK